MSRWKKIALVFAVVLIPTTAIAAVELAEGCGCKSGEQCKCADKCKCNGECKGGADCKCGEKCKCGESCKHKEGGCPHHPK